MDVTIPKPRRRTDCGDGHPISSPYCCGLTLIELMAVIAIMVILIGFAVPSLGQFQASQRVTTQINELAASLALTRSEAVKRNRHVVICKSADGTRCQREDSVWHGGWLVFVDLNYDRERSMQEPILYVHGPLAAGLTLDYSAFGSEHYVAYRPTGFTKTNGTFTLCDARYPMTARALILMKTGRVRASTVKSDGSPLDCDT